MKIFLTLVIFILTVFSCTIQKRIHNPGYHITNGKSTIKNEINISHENDLVKSLDLYSSSNDSSVNNDFESKISSSFLPYSTSISEKKCDTIYKKDGSYILAKTVLIRSKKLLYKDCDGNSTETKTISRDEVYYFVNSTTGNHYLKNDKCDTIFMKDSTFILAQMVRIHKGIVQYKKCDGSSEKTEFVYTDEVSHLKNVNNIRTEIADKKCDTIFLNDGTYILAKNMRIKSTKILYQNCDGISKSVEEIELKDVKSKKMNFSDYTIKNEEVWLSVFLMNLVIFFVLLALLSATSFFSPILTILAVLSLIATLVTGIATIFTYLVERMLE